MLKVNRKEEILEISKNKKDIRINDLGKIYMFLLLPSKEI